MSLSFGLNVKSKPAANGPPSRQQRPTIFDDEFGSDGDDEPKGDNVVLEDISEFDGSTRPSRPAPSTAKLSSKPANKLRPGVAPPKPPVRKGKDKSLEDEFGDVSSLRESKRHAAAAVELDPSIYDYDAFHDVHTSVSTAKKAAEKQDALERKPKYINNLLESAARRKQDQLVAREKLLQKEREAEGDEFADKEKFVTGAYKAQQAETRRLEEEEKKKQEEEERRRRERGGGMQGFYRSVMDDSEKRHREAMEATAILEQNGGAALETDAADKAKTDVELAAELKTKGVNVHINEEGQITDKRQLLSAGLNIAPSGKPGDKHAADHLKASSRPVQNAFQGRRNDQQAVRERQTRMLEQQLEVSAKRAADDEAEERRKLEHASKSRKTEGEISGAKERYLARKREAEEAKKKAKESAG